MDALDIVTKSLSMASIRETPEDTAKRIISDLELAGFYVLSDDVITKKLNHGNPTGVQP